jgi:hypothetical protein
MRSEALTSRSAFNPNPDIDGQVVDVFTFEQAYKGRTSVFEVLCRIEVRIEFCDSDLVRV